MEAERELAEALGKGTEGKVHFKYNGRIYQLDIWGASNYNFDDITPDHVIEIADFPKTDPESDPEVLKSDPEYPDARPIEECIPEEQREEFKQRVKDLSFKK